MQVSEHGKNLKSRKEKVSIERKCLCFPLKPPKHFPFTSPLSPKEQRAKLAHIPQTT
jgi:hypothetical protein